MKTTVLLAVLMSLTFAHKLFASEIDESFTEIQSAYLLLPSGESTWFVELDAPEIYETIRLDYLESQVCGELNYRMEVYDQDLQGWYKVQPLAEGFQTKDYMIDAVRVVFEQNQSFGSLCRVSLVGKVMMATI